jgi:AraC-like DNA-binding protein
VYALPLPTIRAQWPQLSFLGRSVVEAIFLTGGSIGSARDVARRLGLSRFQLARLLKREGLPPLHRLAVWARVLYWVELAEETGASLCSLAARSGLYSSASYRLVKEVTGLCWSDLCARGSGWLLAEFLSRFDMGRQREPLPPGAQRDSHKPQRQAR